MREGRERREVLLHRAEGGRITAVRDLVAVEEPLLIQIGFQQDGRRQVRTVTVTMRTPGHDTELAAGLLFAEGVLHTMDEVHTLLRRPEKVLVELTAAVPVAAARLTRHLLTGSACGVCGKTSLEALPVPIEELPRDGLTARPALIGQLPAKLAAAQEGFASTGGLHAAALFDAAGNLQVVREDVGRHNALDKLLGERFLQRKLPLHDAILMMSSRASFELVQKAARAGIPILATIGAPTTAAIDLAETVGLTLLSFVREQRFNIYSGFWRMEAQQ